jgi:tryptophanyl-tRNA synthetase
LNRFLAPIREKQELLGCRPDFIDEIVWNGTLKMRGIAEDTMRRVHGKMGIDRVWNALRPDKKN